MSTAEKNMKVQISLLHTHCMSFGHILSSGITGSYGSSVFHNGCIITFGDFGLNWLGWVDFGVLGKVSLIITN
jgi:hypothetical protein